MYLKKINFLFLLLGVQFATAQLKIGENPNSIDAASIIELESTTKTLVLTRVTNSQMLSITPLKGALVYNTDTQRVHYYDGTQWNEIKDSASATTQLTKTDIEGMGFVDGTHTTDTNLSKTDIEGMGFVDGAHTTDTNLSKTDIEGMGFVDGAHTTDTNLSKTDIEGMG
ncbi:hypothetical protein MNBD_BACTEROID03-1217, partial [hydrothermal vent metagenome]